MNMSSTAGVVSRDLVPMLRLSDGKPGMFDLSATPENGRTVFYENEGEGDDFAYAGDYTVDAIDTQDYNETTPCTPTAPSDDFFVDTLCPPAIRQFATRPPAA